MANIRDGFAISTSDLASILGITRTTAYAWLKGDEPMPDKVLRIQRLSEIAERVKVMNISRLDQLVHRPLSDGCSLFDVLKAGEDPTALLASLQALAAKEAETRRQQKGSGKNLRSLRICNLHCGNPRLATHLKLLLAKGSMNFTAINGIFRPSGGSSQVLVWNRPEKASCGLTQIFFTVLSIQ